MSIEEVSKWYMKAKDKNKPEDDLDRCFVLMQVDKSKLHSFSKNKKSIIVQCETGRCIISENIIQNSPIVNFNWVSDSTNDHWEFWMNKSSVSDIFERITKTHVEDFNRIFSGDFVNLKKVIK